MGQRRLHSHGDLSAGCVQSLLRFRLGCHNLPWDLGRRQVVPRLHRICTLCAGEHLGTRDEQVPVMSNMLY